MTTTFAFLGDFGDAIDFIFHSREQVAGGAQVGGLGQFGELTWDHMKLSLAAMALAMLISLPLGLWLGHTGRGGFLAINASNVGRAVPSFALIAFFAGAGGLGEQIFADITFKSNVVAAGGLAVLLAAVLDGVFLLLQRAVTPWTRARAT